MSAWIDPLELVRATLDRTGGDECEVHVGGGSEAMTRFADNRIHQPTEARWQSVRVRIALRRDGAAEARTAAASTTDLSEVGLDDVVARARALASAAPRGPVRPPLWPEEVAPIDDDADASERATVDAGPAFRADQAGRALLVARRLGYETAGTYRTRRGEIGDYGQPGIVAYGNHHGVVRRWVPSSVDATCMMRTPGGATGWATAWGARRADVDTERLALRAAEIAAASERPQPVEEGRRLTLLHPAAVAALLPFVTDTFTARSVREGSSLLSVRPDEMLAAAMLSLRADPTHPGLRLRPFDGEGIATEPLVLIADGAPHQLARGRDDGDDAPPNGYGPALPSAAAAAPRALVLDGGTGTVADLVARTPSATVVHRLWYQRLVDPTEVRVTALTRDGVLQREAGRVAHALAPGRVNVSVFDVLRRVVDASEPVRVGGMMVPALLVDGFPFEAAP